MSRMLTYSEEQPGVSRGLGLGVVILIHALLIWALASGLGTKVVEMVKAPIEVVIMKDETLRPDTPPPPPPPKLIEPMAFVPKPEIVVNTPAPPPPAAITAIQSEKKPVPTDTISFSPPTADGEGNSQPPYPPSARRGGQEGRVVLLLTVSETGEVTDGSVAETSGYPLLDNAALRHALSRWHFKPAMRGGKAVPYAFRFAVVFKLRDAG